MAREGWCGRTRQGYCRAGAHRSRGGTHEHLWLLRDLLGEGDVGGLEERPQRARRHSRAQHVAEGEVEEEGVPRRHFWSRSGFEDKMKFVALCVNETERGEESGHNSLSAVLCLSAKSLSDKIHTWSTLLEAVKCDAPPKALGKALRTGGGAVVRRATGALPLVSEVTRLAAVALSLGRVGARA